jgi:thioredoxin-like negative regulator of GroEL
MLNKGEFGNAVVTIVDRDDEPRIAEKIMQGKTVPQIVVYKSGRILRMTGAQTRSRLLELVKRYER